MLFVEITYGIELTDESILAIGHHSIHQALWWSYEIHPPSSDVEEFHVFNSGVSVSADRLWTSIEGPPSSSSSSETYGHVAWCVLRWSANVWHPMPPPLLPTPFSKTDAAVLSCMCVTEPLLLLYYSELRLTRTIALVKLVIIVRKPYNSNYRLGRKNFLVHLIKIHTIYVV